MNENSPAHSKLREVVAAGGVRSVTGAKTILVSVTSTGSVVRDRIPRDTFACRYLTEDAAKTLTDR